MASDNVVQLPTQLKMHSPSAKEDNPVCWSVIAYSSKARFLEKGTLFSVRPRYRSMSPLTSI